MIDLNTDISVGDFVKSDVTGNLGVVVKHNRLPWREGFTDRMGEMRIVWYNGNISHSALYDSDWANNHAWPVSKITKEDFIKGVTAAEPNINYKDYKEKK